MRITFEANTAGFEADEYALVGGVSGGDQYLTFQRDAEDTGEDSGVHLEYGGQANGGYGRVRSCRLTRHILSVDLSGQLGKLANVDGFDVALQLGDASFGAFRTG